jgi:Domain of unknown function (DUF4383)
MRSGSKSPAQLYALGLGLLLVAAGIAGFFWEASFAIGTGAGVEQGFVLGLLAVNGWHNLLHLVTGAIGLAVAGNRAAARLYALTLGVAYALLALLGFVAESNDALFGLLAVNTGDNLLHMLVAAGGMVAGLATPEEPESPPPAVAGADG